MIEQGLKLGAVAFHLRRPDLKLHHMPKEVPGLLVVGALGIGMLLVAKSPEITTALNQALAQGNDTQPALTDNAVNFTDLLDALGITLTTNAAASGDSHGNNGNQNPAFPVEDDDDRREQEKTPSATVAPSPEPTRPPTEPPTQTSSPPPTNTAEPPSPTPTTAGNGNGFGSPGNGSKLEGLPTDTPPAQGTSTAHPDEEATPVKEIQESVNVENLGTSMWFLVYNGNTYNRVFEGNYRVFRDVNGRIMHAFDSKGNKIDVAMFERGDGVFGWEGVKTKSSEIFPYRYTSTFPFINTGNTDDLIEEIEVNLDGRPELRLYKITALRILVGKSDTEFIPYYLPWGVVRLQDGFAIDDGSMPFSENGWNRVEDYQKAKILLTTGDLVNREIFVRLSTYYDKSPTEVAKEYDDEKIKERVFVNAHFRTHGKAFGTKSEWPPQKSFIGAGPEIILSFFTPPK